MTRAAPLAVLLGLAACGGSSSSDPGPAPGELRLPAPAPRQGDRWDSAETAEVRLDVGGAGGSHLVTTSLDRATVEVLAVAGDTPTSIRVALAARSGVRTDATGAHPRPSSLVGQTLVAARSGQSIAVSGGDGVALVGAALDDGIKAVDEWLQPPVVTRFLAGRPWRVGAAVALPAAQLAELGAARAGGSPMVVTSMQLTLTAIDPREAHFAMVVATVTGNDLHFALTGAMRVERARGRVVDNALDGTVTGTLQGRPVTGEMHHRQQLTYR